MSRKQQIRTRVTGLDPECLWMQAGIVKNKRCLQDFQCPACSFDRALRREAERNKQKQGNPNPGPREKIEHWEQRLRRLPQMSRPCVHYMKGEIEFRPCTNDYQCASCDFEQYFDDIYLVRAELSPRDLHYVHGYKLPHGYYIYPGHTWIRLEEDSVVKIGVTEFAARVLGFKNIDSIQAPLVGKKVAQGKKGIQIYKQDSKAELLSPVSGVVMNFNPDLQEHPELIWEKPYTEGWILRVNASALRNDLKNLTLGPQADELVNKDLNKIFACMEQVHGPLAADGGELVDDVSAHVPELDWDNLKALVLKT